jgi:hypothetical protein
MVFSMGQRPVMDQDLLYEVTQSHTRSDSGRVIKATQKHLPDNTQYSQVKGIHAPGGIQTRKPS